MENMIPSRNASADFRPEVFFDYLEHSNFNNPNLAIEFWLFQELLFRKVFSNINDHWQLIEISLLTVNRWLYSRISVNRPRWNNVQYCKPNAAKSVKEIARIVATFYSL